mgnify:FL=1
MILKANDVDNTKRIDVFLMEKTDYSRTKVQSLIKDKKVKANGICVKPSYRVKENDNIEYEEYQEKEMSAEPMNIPLDIIYEDDDVIVVNKQNGMVVHPAIGNESGTLVNALLFHSKNLSDINGEFRPGIVHRIDAYTTGLLVVAKNNKAHELLAKQLEDKTTYRKYLALVWGVLPSETGTIDAPIGRDPKDRKKMAVTDKNARDAVTHFKVIERFKKATLIEVKLETGRTHQIRVHMDYIGYPVVNDPVYGHRKIIDETGQCLHAYELGFVHPKTNEYMKFTCQAPECFKKIEDMFREDEI